MKQIRIQARQWIKKSYKRLIPPSSAESTPSESLEASLPGEVQRRGDLLAEYKASTGNPSNKRIYEARNSGIHKPEFYEWLKGVLSARSSTAINFERFLREKKPPIPRK